MKVFEMVRRWADEPVTIFAETEEIARSVYRRWIQAQHKGRPMRPTTIYPFNEQQLTHRPVLAAAAVSEASGVGYWDRGAERWRVVSPEAAPPGDLVEPEPRVGYHEFITVDGDFTMVFGETIDHATTLYCAYKLHQHGILPAAFRVCKMTRWDLKWEHITLRDDMHADICGIGLPNERGIWRILPPEHD